MKIIPIIGVVTITLIALASCTPANRKRALTGREAAVSNLEPGKGDAYLFDVKVKHRGKKRSTRLDIYSTRDSISFFARAYLGKGVMKVLIVHDSVTIYFPTEKQYFAGKLSNLIGNKCAVRFPAEKLIIELFHKTPVEISDSSKSFYVNVVKESSDDLHYRLISRECDETVDIRYERKDERYVPYRILYERNDGSFKLDARRRQSRLNITIPAEKFRISIPEGTDRIYP